MRHQKVIPPAIPRAQGAQGIDRPGPCQILINGTEPFKITHDFKRPAAGASKMPDAKSWSCCGEIGDPIAVEITGSHGAHSHPARQLNRSRELAAPAVEKKQKLSILK